jgi:hypothetical protein
MSVDHSKCEISRLQWLAKKRLDDCFDTQCDAWNACVERYRRVAGVMIDAVKYLGKEQMAFRGHSTSDGKFNNLFTLLAKYEPAASAYLQMLQKKAQYKVKCNLLSPGNQKRLL